MKRHRLINSANFFSMFMICLFSSIMANPASCIARGEASIQMIQYDKPFFIQMDLSEFRDNPLIQSDNLINVLIYSNPLDAPEVREMQKIDELYETMYTLTDTSVKMLMIAFQIEHRDQQSAILLTDDQGNTFRDFLVCSEANIPVRGAHQAIALSYTGLAGLRNEDLDLAVREAEKELELYPDNFSARNLLYTILLRKNEYSSRVRNQIKKEIDQILGQNPADENTMNFAIGAYRIIGDVDSAQEIENEIIEQNPQSYQASLKAFNEIMEIENSEERAEQLELFLIQFPESQLNEWALSSLASALIEQNDLAKLIDVGDQLLTISATSGGASGLAGIGGVLSEEQVELNRASVYLEKALALIRSAALADPPPEMTQKEWEERVRVTEARYRDILGWIYFQQGKIENSITELRKAAEGSSQPGVYYHLAEALNLFGNTDEAILNYARAAAFDGNIADRAYDIFTDLWLQFRPATESMELFLDQQKEWIENSYRNKVLSQKVTRRAPDFELSDLRNEWIKLSDQKGSVILLCFWATWSSSSEYLLETLDTLYGTLGQKILFLTIAVDREESDIRDYVIQHQIAFPVLFNNATDEDYQLQGVPTLFLIDRNGEIQFEHKGYRPDIDQLLLIEVEDLLSSK